MSAITGEVLLRRISAKFSSRFAVLGSRTYRGRAWGWPMCRRSCGGMEARSNATPRSGWARRLSSLLPTSSPKERRMPAEQSVTILLVEDDPGHARLIERNLRRAHIMNEIVTLGDGQQALDYLFKEGIYAGATHTLSLLLLLDLILPQLDGYQVLTRLKADARTKHIPVIMLTTVDDPYEIERCYALGCSVYVTKPIEYEQFEEAIRKLGLFLSIVQIPPGK